MNIYFLWHVKTEIFTSIKTLKQTRNKVNKTLQ